MQVTTLSTQLGPGSELVDWYRDATSVPFDLLMVDLSPRRDDRLRYCTNTGSIPSNFCIRDRLKQSKMLDVEHTKSHYSPSDPIIFAQMQKSFPSVIPNRVHPVSLRTNKNSARRKTAKRKKTSQGKTSKRSSSIVYNVELGSKEETFWCAKEGYSSSKLLLLPSLTICLDMEKFVLVPASVYNKKSSTQSVTKQEFPKYQPSQNPTYQIDSLKKEIKKKVFSKADSLADKVLSRSLIKLSSSQTLILDGDENGIFLSDSAQQLRRMNAEVPDIYFSLLDAAGIAPTPFLNQNAKTKERGSCVPFKI